MKIKNVVFSGEFPDNTVHFLFEGGTSAELSCFGQAFENLELSDEEAAETYGGDNLSLNWVAKTATMRDREGNVLWSFPVRGIKRNLPEWF